MKKFSLLVTLVAGLSTLPFSISAQEIQKDLKSFSRIVASPKINLILEKGDHESIRLVYNNVNENAINIEVRNQTLQIYLDHARKVERVSESKYGSKMMYHDATVTAYVTYTSLESLEIRGNQELTCNDPIESEEFRLKAYGENEITLASLKTDFFKASLYCENLLKIKKWKVV